MNYKIDINSNTPIYIQLYEQLKKDIVNGVYPYNSKLPSKRTFKEELNISLITIEHTLDLLIEEGYIESKEKRGYFVSFQKGIILDNVVRNKVSNKIASNSDRNDEFPFTVISKAMRRVITNYDKDLLEKSPNKGHLELRKEIAEYLARSRSIHVDIEQIVIGSGAEYLYGLIAQLFKNDSKIAIEKPSYNKIEKVYKAFNKELIKLPLMDDGINLKDLYSSNVNILHITPFHSYPSGISTSTIKKHLILDWTKEKERIIIEDNYDSELTISSKNEDSLFMMSNNDNVIYLNTFSKTLSSSLRIGYMVLPKSLIKKFDEELGFYSCTVSTYTQLLISELLSNGDFERHINRIRRSKRKLIKQS